MRMLSVVAVCLLSAVLVSPAWAGDVDGRVTDRTGGALPGTSLQLLNIATGEQAVTTADREGHFHFAAPRVGIYRVAASLSGFSDASRTLVVEDATKNIALDFELELGSLKAEVTVSADRGERDEKLVPLRIDTVPADTIREAAPLSTGDAMAAVPGVTLVGSGPFQARPRLRGLDSTRVLVLVDGERLNNARSATERTGVEVGLVDLATIEDIEVLGGAGSVLYGTDALSGTINIITNRPRFSDRRLMTAGFDGFYSSNESGRRSSVTLGASDRKWSVLFTGGAERYDDYTAGKDFSESSQPFLTNGTIHRIDTIDDNFGFKFGKFPDPFNAPFTRTSALIANSAMRGSSATAAGIVQVTPTQLLDVKYQARRAENVGFPDFTQPFFFQSITLPTSNLDKFSAGYTFTRPTPWLSQLSVRSYYQKQDRLLRNQQPIQFPAPAATFFPITVFRLNRLSDTRQQVWTPGVDVQAVFLPRPNNVLTAGMTAFRDRSRDERTTTTETTMIGQVAVGAFGPAATVFAAPVVLGAPEVAHPARVPNATFRDTGLFLHDEWHAAPAVRITTGLRVDAYRVLTDPTPGYDVASLIKGATPAVDVTTLPNVDGDRIARTAFTGEAGVVLWSERRASLFSHYVHSYRHPNLEELLFSGPATAGNIVPNVKVKPETGHNFDMGTRVRVSHLSGSLSYFANTYTNFISTEVVAATTTNGSSSSISQAINLAKVRIQGVEAEAQAPFVLGMMAVLPSGSVAYNHGTVLSGTSPLSGTSLAGQPQDNVTPWKISAALRVGDRSGHWWGAYSVRTQADVTRVSPLLSQSSFLIPQDLMGLAGFSIQRIAGGYDWRRGNQVLGLTVSVDNASDLFYREQFQFAPARGRSVSVNLHVRGVR